MIFFFNVIDVSGLCKPTEWKISIYVVGCCLNETVTLNSVTLVHPTKEFLLDLRTLLNFALAGV
jgi:hypothetical protein